MPNDDAKRGLNLPVEATEKVPDGQSYFFGVGIDEYQHFQSLSNAVKDVKDVEKLLKAQYDLDESITLFNKEATRGNIISALDRIKRKISPRDKLLIYYSGHGHLDENKRGYWIPVDAQVDYTQNYIRNATIREYLEDIKAKHILIISDSCFSGRLATRSTNQAATSEKALAEMNSYPSRWLLASGRHDQEVADGRPGTNSPFTASIIQFLQDFSGDFLNISQLAEYTTRATVHNYDQLPVGSPLFGVGHVDGGQYIFKKKDKELPFVPTKTPPLVAGGATGAPPRTLPLKQKKRGLPKALWYIIPLFLILGVIAIYQISIANQDKGPIVEKEVDPKDLDLDNRPLPNQPAEINKTKEDSKSENTRSTPPKKTNSQPETKIEKKPAFNFATVDINGKIWTQKNQAVILNGSNCYDIASSCNQNGRLYTWEAARKACSALGPGWRLPTQKEWETHYRGLVSYNALPLAGWGDDANGFYKQGVEGFYWTQKEAVAFQFNNNGQSSTAKAQKDWLYSCKCIYAGR